jgi:hypothetical protein
MAHILFNLSIVDSLLGRKHHQGKEKERTNHGKTCKKEGFSAPPPDEEQTGRQRPSQAGKAHGPQVFGSAQGQGRLNRSPE